MARPKHQIWKQGFSSRVCFEKKNGFTIKTTKAFCHKCSKLLTNTSQRHLISHRRVCYWDPNPQNSREREDDAIEAQPNVGVSNSSRSITNKRPAEDLQSQSEGSTASSLRDDETTSESSRDSINLVEESADEVTTQVQKKIKTDQIGYFFDKVSDRDRFIFHKDLLKLFVSLNVDLSDVLKSKYLKNFVKSIRPALKVPSLENLLSIPLEECVAEIETSKNKSQFAGILIVNIDEESSECVSMVMNHDRHFVVVKKSNDVIIDLKDVTDFINKSIQCAEKIFDVKISFVLGNSELIKNQELVIEKRKFWYQSCVSLKLKSFLNGFCKTNLFEKIKKVLVSLKDEFEKDFEIEFLQFLTLEKCHKFYEISEFCLKNLIKLRGVLVNQPDKISESLRNILFENDFENTLKNVTITMKVISEIQLNQELSLADTVEIYYNLLSDITDPSLKNLIEETLVEIISPLSLLTNFVHPKYQGKKFFNEQNLEKISSCAFTQLSGKAIPDFGLYINRNKNKLFKTLLEKNDLSPLEFWKAVSLSHEELANLCINLITIPAFVNKNKCEFIESKSFSSEQNSMLKTLFYHLKLNK